jgi:hypothetical protein
MTKAVRVAQGGAESHPFQGIAGQFPTIYRCIRAELNALAAQAPPRVMAVLVPAIHGLPFGAKNVDARDKPGHDDLC